MKKLSIFLLALVAGAGTMFASDTSVDGIWYNFDDEYLTAKVTYQGVYYNSYPDRYSGEVVIPSSVTYNDQTYSVTCIGDGAFYECIGLTSITIPNSVTSIMSQAFQDCTGLTSVTIPNGVTNIGPSAFDGCSGLTSLSVEAGNTVYDSRNNCNAIIETSTNTLILGCQNTTIPNTVTGIGEGAFQNCSGLTSVTIPNSVTSIGDWAFYGCTGLTSLSVEAGNTVYDSRNNCNAIIETSTNTLIFGCPNTTIPNSVTSIGEMAFIGCTGLISVTIPDSVTSIGSYAFAGCTGLTSVTNYATTPQSINSNVFYDVNKSTCVLNVPMESVSLYQAADVWKEFTNIVGVDVPGVPSSTPAVYTNPANPAQKLIKDGNVYILTDDKTYTITGQQVK